MSNKNIPNFISGEIYVITCKPTGKQYVGQTMTHRWNSGRQKWYKRGYMFRFSEHIKEAYSDKSTQCWALNNAIKKYGAKNFTCELIHKCSTSDLDGQESKFIKQYNTFEDGYNLNEGGWGGALHDSVYDRISNTNHKKTDIERTEYLKLLTQPITKVRFNDKTIGFHCVSVDIHTDSKKIRWVFSNRNNNVFKSFMRAYFLLYDYVSDSLMEISMGLLHYLIKDESFLVGFDDFIPVHEPKSETTAKNMSNLQTRINRYKNLEIQHITLKLRKKGNLSVVCVCIRSPSKKREIVSQFGGEGISYQTALEMAEEFSYKLAPSDKISMRPDLRSFMEVHNLKLKTPLPITRKPRNVFNKSAK